IRHPDGELRRQHRRPGEPVMWHRLEPVWVLCLATTALASPQSEPDGTTPLHWAVRQDDAATADRLIRTGANVKAANRYGVTPLSLACTNGNAAMIEKLLKAGADPNAAGEENETALMTVARTGNVEAAKVLLAHGAK